MSIQLEVGYKNKVVMIYDKNEFPITVCDTITEAANYLGVSRNRISNYFSVGNKLIKDCIVMWVKI